MAINEILKSFRCCLIKGFNLLLKLGILSQDLSSSLNNVAHLAFPIGSILKGIHRNKLDALPEISFRDIPLVR